MDRREEAVRFPASVVEAGGGGGGRGGEEAAIFTFQQSEGRESGEGCEMGESETWTRQLGTSKRYSLPEIFPVPLPPAVFPFSYLKKN